MIRVVIADDHHLVREGIRALLNRAEDIEVVGEAGDGGDAIELTIQMKPDVLVMDITMPGINGIQALQQLSALSLDTRTVMLSMHAGDILVREAVQYGAKCYLVKGPESDELLDAIRAANRGASYFSPVISDSIVSDDREYATKPAKTGMKARLTQREHEVLQLISEGYTNNDIAGRMHISVKTVERHRTGLMSKLDAHNLVELIRAAIKQRLITFED